MSAVSATYLLLKASYGEPLRTDVIEFVAEPMVVSGRVLRYDDMLVMHATSIERVAE